MYIAKLIIYYGILPSNDGCYSSIEPRIGIKHSGKSYFRRELSAITLYRDTVVNCYIAVVSAVGFFVQYTY